MYGRRYNCEIAHYIPLHCNVGAGGARSQAPPAPARSKLLWLADAVIPRVWLGVSPRDPGEHGCSNP